MSESAPVAVSLPLLCVSVSFFVCMSPSVSAPPLLCFFIIRNSAIFHSHCAHPWHINCCTCFLQTPFLVCMVGVGGRMTLQAPFPGSFIRPIPALFDELESLVGDSN